MSFEKFQIEPNEEESIVEEKKEPSMLEQAKRKLNKGIVLATAIGAGFAASANAGEEAPRNEPAIENAQEQADPLSPEAISSLVAVVKKEVTEATESTNEHLLKKPIDRINAFHTLVVSSDSLDDDAKEVVKKALAQLKTQLDVLSVDMEDDADSTQRQRDKLAARPDKGESAYGIDLDSTRAKIIKQHESTVGEIEHQLKRAERLGASISKTLETL